MKQTAVEWLVQKLSKKRQLKDRDLHLIEQAKAMEKKQNYNLDNLRDAYRWGTTVRIGTSDHFEEFLQNIKTK